MNRTRRNQGMVKRDLILAVLSVVLITVGLGLIAAVEMDKKNSQKGGPGETVEEGWMKGEVPFKRSETKGQYLSEKDNSTLIYLEGGAATLGAANMAEGEALAEKEVEVGSYLIDKTEVTNLQYQTFVKAVPTWQKGGEEAVKKADANYLRDWKGTDFPEGRDNHPVVWVSWHAAQAYAQWAGKQLPTEVQWERAARGTDQRKYPWGDEPPSADRCNFGGMKKGTVPVDSLAEGASPAGCHHMAGNVWEWTQTETEIDGATFAVLRGGSWNNIAENTTTYYRHFESLRLCDGNIGFRCAWSPSDK